MELIVAPIPGHNIHNFIISQMNFHSHKIKKKNIKKRGRIGWHKLSECDLEVNNWLNWNSIWGGQDGVVMLNVL